MEGKAGFLTNKLIILLKNNELKKIFDRLHDVFMIKYLLVDLFLFKSHF